MDDNNIINDNYIKILKGIFIFTEEDKKFKPILNGVSRDGVFLIRDPFDSNYNPAHTFKLFKGKI